MITNITYKSYIVFAVINLVTVPCVYFFFPETCRRPLESVDLLFADREGKRPGILRVVRDSKDRAFVEEMDRLLEERSRGENGVAKGGMEEHVEVKGEV